MLVATAIFFGFGLTGCGGYLPSQGPTLQAVVDSSTKPLPSFALVEICDPVLDALSHWGTAELLWHVRRSPPAGRTDHRHR